MIFLRIAVRIFLAGTIGACVGMLVAYFTGLSRQLPPGTEHLPYPHVVPKTQDSVSLRFAMVHDVIHERLPRHGTAYYKERNRRVRLALEELKAKSPAGPPQEKHFELLDDLAVGLDRAGEPAEAIRVMRDKLKQQIDLGLPRPQLYSTYANLGTLLILGPFRQVRPGNEQDKKTLREGLECIRTAIKINPDSHFGREIWQAVIIEYMIALYDDPEMLLRFDMIGNRLEKDLDGTDRHPISDFGTKAGDAGPLRWGNRFGGVAMARRTVEYLQGSMSWDQVKHVRTGITRVGAEAGWTDSMHASHIEPVSFDEPTLGIVGMWRLGGGAHPYFAVALGETMLRVGQRYIAWNAFERAARMAKHTWPEPGLQERFAAHCRRRQNAIEKTLPSDAVGKLRLAFDAELALGMNFQSAYQEYEEKQIAAGRSIEDPRFYDEFLTHRAKIASPVGDADWFHAGAEWTAPWMLSAAILFAGLFALGAAILPLRVAPSQSGECP